MLDIRDLRFSYTSRPVLQGVDLRLEPGELVFLLGANGAGKSTLFRCALGLLPGYEGEISLHGRDIRRLSARALAREMAYIPQSHHPAFSYPVLDMVLMGAQHRLSPFANPGPREEAAALAALDQVGIAGLAGRDFQRLSGGEQQLVLIARALAQQARLLLMDEPTSSLDFGNRVRVLDQVSELARRGYAILLSCHDPQLALLYAHRVVALHQGKVAADGPPEDVLDPALLHTLYQVPVRFTPTPYGTLLSPIRRQGFDWTEERVAYLEAAAEGSDYYERIAQAAAEAAPGAGVICDAGCGLGFSSLALARHFKKVVAAERSHQALTALRAKPLPPNLELLEGDLFAHPPAEPYDAMLFCFFGSAGEILRCARAQCRGRVVAVKAVQTGRRFSQGPVPGHRHGAAALEERLKALGVPYTRRELDLRLDQPLRSVADGVAFFRLYSRDPDPAALTEDFVRARLVAQDDPEYPYRLPAERRAAVIAFDVQDLPPVIERSLEP